MLVPAALLAGCGGATRSADVTRNVHGQGFRFQTPGGWQIRRGLRSLSARQDAALVSVTVFPLVKRYEPRLFSKVVPELDRVARQLAAREGATLRSPRTEQVGGRDARVYELARGGQEERIAFVLAARREYQLFCKPTGDACDLLLTSFSLSN